MRRWPCRMGMRLAGLGLSLTLVTPASAVEYRLRVASAYEEGIHAYLSIHEGLVDGATGPGLDRLEASLTEGSFARGGLLYDRHVRPAGRAEARGFEAVAAEAPVRHGDPGAWDEVRWQGEPGQQTAWVVQPRGLRPQEVARVALGGAGPLRLYQPYALIPGSRLPVARLPLAFLLGRRDDGSLWEGHLASGLDLGDGIAAVVGRADFRNDPDVVYLIVRGGLQATVYRAVIGWRPAPERDFEAPPRWRRQP